MPRSLPIVLLLTCAGGAMSALPASGAAPNVATMKKLSREKLMAVPATSGSRESGKLSPQLLRAAEIAGAGQP